MTTFAWGSGLVNPARTRLGFISNSQGLPSPLSGAIHVAVRAGSLWRYEATWQAITGIERGDILGFFTRLNGMEHRVQMPVFPEAKATLGGWATLGSPQIALANETGRQISCTGAPASSSKYVRRGDIFTFDNMIRRATTDADSDGTGAFTVNFEPAIRTSPAQFTSINTGADAEGVWIMTSDVEHPDIDDTANGDVRSDLTLSFVSDVLA